MNRLFMPWTSGAIFFSWQLLMGEISLLSVLGGLLFAYTLPRVCARFVPDGPAASNPRVVIRLFWCVLIDIVKSNIIVARQVLGPIADLKPGFISVPVETDHPYVISLLASIITMTPGTVSARIRNQPDTAGASILVHVLSCDDEQALIDEIKERYEKPLLEIFQC